LTRAIGRVRPGLFRRQRPYCKAGECETLALSAEPCRGSRGTARAKRRAVPLLRETPEGRSDDPVAVPLGVLLGRDGHSAHEVSKLVAVAELGEGGEQRPAEQVVEVALPIGLLPGHRGTDGVDPPGPPGPRVGIL